MIGVAPKLFATSRNRSATARRRRPLIACLGAAARSRASSPAPATRGADERATSRGTASEAAGEHQRAAAIHGHARRGVDRDAEQAHAACRARAASTAGSSSRSAAPRRRHDQRGHERDRVGARARRETPRVRTIGPMHQRSSPASPEGANRMISDEEQAEVEQPRLRVAAQAGLQPGERRPRRGSARRNGRRRRCRP